MSKILGIVFVLLLIIAASIFGARFYLEGRISAMQKLHVSQRIEAGKPMLVSTSNGDLVEVTSIEPASPATLKAGESVKLKYRYVIKSAGQVSTFAFPKGNGERLYSGMPGHEDGGMVTPIGSDTGEWTFIFSEGHLDEIEVFMLNVEFPARAYALHFRDRMKVDDDMRLLTMIIPASYTWVAKP